MLPIWKQWIHIILKYENGILFIENEYLTDNDFDNLITDNDKNFADFNDIETPGTPSSGKESPFDEMKKFDMFWGVNVAAVPKVIYKCPNVTKENLKSPIQTILMISGIAQRTVRPTSALARWKTASVNVETKYVPFLQKGTSAIKVFRGVEKKLGKDTYFLAVLWIKTRPLWYQATWNTRRFEAVFKSQRREGEGIGLKGFSVWKPIAPQRLQMWGMWLITPQLWHHHPTGSIVCVPENAPGRWKKKWSRSGKIKALRRV